MGLFDFLKKKPAAEVAASHSSASSPAASETELRNHKRKQQFYKFAFQYFPGMLFSKTESTIMVFAKGQQSGLESMLSMYNSMGSGAIEKEDIAKCKLSYFDGFKGNKSVLVISYPGASEPTGNLTPIFGPYYSAMIYSPANLNEVEYFVLCQSFDGKTSFRQVNAQGMNINCGPGPAADSDEMAFLTALQNLN